MLIILHKAAQALCYSVPTVVLKFSGGITESCVIRGNFQNSELVLKTFFHI